MKNTQIKAILVCICILIASISITLFSIEQNSYSCAFIGIFIALSSFIITFLFINRYICMSKMLNGTDLISFWEYSKVETIQNISQIKNQNKGLWVMAVPTFSLLAIVISITVGIASNNFGEGVLLSIIIILINITLFKLYISHTSNEIPEKQDIELKTKDKKKSYVYISSTGIYAHGMLHVWKGWASTLKEIQYNPYTKNLSFTYSYLRPYSFGNYTVVVHIPEQKLGCIQEIKDSRLSYKFIE